MRPLAPARAALTKLLPLFVALVRVVSNYLLWRFVRHRVNSLGDRFGAAKQRLLHALMGREAVPPRWKTCVAHVNSHMGMALGALFVTKYFNNNSKQDVSRSQCSTATREHQHPNTVKKNS